MIYVISLIISRIIFITMNKQNQLKLASFFEELAEA